MEAATCSTFSIFLRVPVCISNGLAHFLGCGHGFFCQFAHFVGHYCKSTPGSARTGCLYGGVKGQQIGLIRNIGNNIKYLSNTLARLPSRDMSSLIASDWA